MRQNKGFLELRRLEAAREIASTLANSGNKIMLDSESLLLNGKYLERPHPMKGSIVSQLRVMMPRRY
jgi:prohibitin 2